LLKKRETALLFPPQKKREGRASCRGDHTQNAEFTHQKRMKDAILRVVEKVMGMYPSQPDSPV